MKKIFLTILSVLCLLCFAFAAAACGGDEEETVTEYDVTLVANYEGGATSTAKYEEGTSLEPPASPAAPDGKVFSYWSYDQEGQTRAEFPLTVDSDLTLYAQWQTAQTGETQHFTLKFSVSGAISGTEAPADITAAAGETVSLPDGAGIERDFYLLGGWRDENGETYALGAQYTVSADMTFSPVWERAVTVVFSANGATGEAPAARKVPENSTLTLPSQGSLAKEGYTFDGWLNGAGDLVRAGKAVELGDAQTVTFRAAWNGAYNITFDTEIKRETFTSPQTTGSRISLPEPADVENMEFHGWLYRGNTYAANARFTVGYEDIEFTADLRERGANVEYRDADGSLIRSVFYGSDETVAAPEDLYPLALTEFTGWTDGSGAPVELSSITEDTAVYASYSVAFADAGLFTYTTYRDGLLINGKGLSYQPSIYRSLAFPVGYNGKPVYGIYNAAAAAYAPFAHDSDLNSVRIPSGWTLIGAYAFYGSKLSSVEFAEGGRLQEIGGSAFSGSALTSVSVPDSVKTVGRSAFSDCASLKQAHFGENSGITMFSDGTENHRSSIFSNCTSLTDVTLPGKLEVIGLTAFQYCPIERIEFPASLRIIGQAAFNYCDRLTEAVLPANSRLEEVQRAAFGWCKKLKSIDLPSSVKTIAYNAFTSCEELESVSFGEVTAIGETAFFRCYALSRVNSETDGEFNLPATLQEIGNGAFAMCSSMEQVNFGDGSALKSVGLYAFAANLYHDSTHYPGDHNWGDYGYESVTMSLRSIRFPAGVETIGKYVLYNVFSLETVGVEAGNTHYTADGRGLYENDTHKLIAFALASAEAAYTLAADCTALDDYVLSGDMRGGVVYGSPLVKEITLPQGLRVLPYTSFLCNTELTKVVVPAGSELTTVEEAAFANCVKLASFNFEEAAKLQTIGVEAFENVALVTVSLPASLREICNFAFYQAAKLETVQFAPDSALETIGIGAFSGNANPDKEAEGNVVIGSHLRTFTLPKSVVSVGTQAFAYTTRLETFTFEEGSPLTAFSANMFQWSGVQRIENIPETLTSIGQYAFSRTSRLKSFEMSHIESIGLNAFSYSAIETVALYGSYETLTVRAFDSCGRLTSVTLGDRVKNIGNYAFVDCSSLEEIVLPASCTALGACSFQGCTSFKRITLPAASVVRITADTFDLSRDEGKPGNLQLEEINVPASLAAAYRADTYWRDFADAVKEIGA